MAFAIVGLSRVPLPTLLVNEVMRFGRLVAGAGNAGWSLQDEFGGDAVLNSYRAMVKPGTLMVLFVIAVEVVGFLFTAPASLERLGAEIVSVTRLVRDVGYELGKESVTVCSF